MIEFPRQNGAVGPGESTRNFDIEPIVRTESVRFRVDVIVQFATFGRLGIEIGVGPREFEVTYRDNAKPPLFPPEVSFRENLLSPIELKIPHCWFG